MMNHGPGIKAGLCVTQEVGCVQRCALILERDIDRAPVGADPDVDGERRGRGDEE